MSQVFRSHCKPEENVRSRRYCHNRFPWAYLVLWMCKSTWLCELLLNRPLPLQRLGKTKQVMTPWPSREIHFWLWLITRQTIYIYSLEKKNKRREKQMGTCPGSIKWVEDEHLEHGFWTSNNSVENEQKLGYLCPQKTGYTSHQKTK